jgi:hypothetical protein
MTAPIIYPKPVQAIRNELRRKWQDAFDDGARCAFTKTYPGPREPGGYPPGFHDWPLEKRNVWFAGFNLGLIDLARLQEEGAQHG